MAPAVVQIAGPIYRIPTTPLDLINTFALLEDDGSVTLVDCGTRFAMRPIVAGLRQLGKAPQDVRRILVTHAHSDHTGSAASLVAAAGVDGVMAHPDDVPFIADGRNAPGVDGLWTRFLHWAKIDRFSPPPVTHELADGEVLDIAGGLVVHHTPGHTPGHVAFTHTDTQVLLTGDVIFHMGSRLTWPMAAVCTSLAQNKESAVALVDTEFQTAAFAHGPEIRDRAREQLRSWVAGHR